MKAEVLLNEVALKFCLTSDIGLHINITFINQTSCVCFSICLGIWAKMQLLLLTISGMNYYLAIIPFLGALESDVFGKLPYDVEMLPPNEHRDDFCHSIDECNTQVPQVMLKWKRFFKVKLPSLWMGGYQTVFRQEHCPPEAVSTRLPWDLELRV